MRYFWLRNLGEIHSLLSALADPQMRCSGSRARAVSRLFLDVPGNVSRAVGKAKRLGLVRVGFRNPYFLGSGEHFINLTKRGDRCVDGINRSAS